MLIGSCAQCSPHDAAVQQCRPPPAASRDFRLKKCTPGPSLPTTSSWWVQARPGWLAAQRTVQLGRQGLPFHALQVDIDAANELLSQLPGLLEKCAAAAQVGVQCSVSGPAGCRQAPPTLLTVRARLRPAGAHRSAVATAAARSAAAAAAAVSARGWAAPRRRESRPRRQGAAGDAPHSSRHPLHPHTRGPPAPAASEAAAGSGAARRARAEPPRGAGAGAAPAAAAAAAAARRRGAGAVPQS